MNEPNKLVAARIKECRKKLGLTQLELGQAANVTKTSVVFWEQGRNLPSGEALLELEKLFECDSKWILTGEGKNNSKTYKEEKINTIKQKAYPLIDWGDLKNISKCSTNQYYFCPNECSNDTFALQVRGDSMQPTIKDKDIIFIDPKRKAKNGDYIVVSSGSKSFLRKVTFDGSLIYLHIENNLWDSKATKLKKEDTILGTIVSSITNF